MCSTERDQLHLPGHPTTNALFSGELALKQQKADRFRLWYVRRSEFISWMACFLSARSLYPITAFAMRVRVLGLRFHCGRSFSPAASSSVQGCRLKYLPNVLD